MSEIQKTEDQQIRSSSIQRRQRERQPRKPKKSQIPFAVVLLVIIVTIGMLIPNIMRAMFTPQPIIVDGVQTGYTAITPAQIRNIQLSWVFGISFGYVLQRARFCFTAGFRDPIITGSTSLTRALLVAFAVGSIGFTLIHLGTISLWESGIYRPIPDSGIGQGAITTNLFIGAIIFGIGMVIAGGCASGTLMRVGEGFTALVIAFIFFGVGNWLAGAFLGDGPLAWPNAILVARTHLPSMLGGRVFWALVIQFTIILAVYIIAVKWQKKKLGSDE